jgi:hypothetical protein
MSRLARRRSLSLAAAVVAGMVAPAAASAATYTVSPGAGACAGADLACGGLAEAATAVNAGAGGDTINVAAGTYPGATFNVGGLTINGGAGVAITSTVEFTAGAVSTLSKVAVGQSGAVDAVRVTGTSAGLELSDAVVLSQHGNGVLIAAGAANRIVRSLVTSGGGPSAIRVISTAGTPAKVVTLESTIAGGGGSGIGAVTTGGLAAGGNITLILRHVTAAGTSNGILLDASSGAFAVLGGGSIGATLTDSIALNNVTRNDPGLLGIGANSATIDATRSLLTGDAATLFANPARLNFRLRPDAVAAIGQGGMTAGESAADFEGEDRAAAPTDLGGDEYNNAPPVAKIVVKTPTPRATRAVTFDGSGSIDREASYGGGITQYQWSFSDGKTETTAGPTVRHAFPKEGNAAAQLVVADREGAASAPATVALKLVDGTPPTVGIVKPNNNQKIKLFTTNKKTKKRTRTKLVFGGLARDANGIAQIVLTLEKIKTGSGKSTKCNWFDAKKGFVNRSCQRPVLIAAQLKKNSTTGEWSYTIKRNLNRGTYKLAAVGIDKTGASGNAGGSQIGVRRFRLI